ncbi:MAG: hypothetical protein KJZ84_07040, partial [Bryobacteraceae bacterium]|nr:hypothetical protein [Bryobacteraceae bacterium]
LLRSTGRATRIPRSGLVLFLLCAAAHKRKNWIHVGSPQAGPKVAAILSVVETCKRVEIPVREYLAAVLPGLADVKIQKIPELTPAAWAARRR